MKSKETYEELSPAEDTAAEKKALDNLAAIDKAYFDNPTLALARLQKERPVMFTQEELMLAYGRPTEWELNRQIDDITPDRMGEFDDAYMTPEEYWAARKRLDFLYRKRPALGSPEVTEEHWTNKDRDKND